MELNSPAVQQPAGISSLRHQRLEELRSHARSLLDGGATGIQVAAAICEATDTLLVDIFQDCLEGCSDAEVSCIQDHAALVAVGGSGRGELAPYSDADVLFLHEAPASRLFVNLIPRAVREYWDAGIQLGHALRTVGESISMARQDSQIATALVEARLLWGGKEFFNRFQRKFRRAVIHRRRASFIEGCIAARLKEREQHGSTVHQLEPDIKRSPGGLRDVHLIRWLGAANFDTHDIDSLRLHGALSRDDARLLISAQEFLMRARIELHFAAGRAQDVLSREDQLRLADRRNIQPVLGQRPVEILMQNYFRHSSAIANIAERFVARYQPRSLFTTAARVLMSHRADGVFLVGHGSIHVSRRNQDLVCANLERALQLFHTAALYGVDIDPELLEHLRHSQTSFTGAVSPESAKIFLQLLSRIGHVGQSLRSMYATGILELVVPDMSHARCLLQFNQYHSYTVDEHTLRAVEAAERFQQDKGPVGAAYRSIKNKWLLHLALLLHDLGKGFDEDHSDVGRMIALSAANRLYLTDEQRDTLAFLVHKHLNMNHIAFRRDFTNPGTLVEFSRLVGSAERLRMLYVLTAADLSAVGPGVWTDWKAEVLAELFDRTMLMLSGKPYAYQEEQRLQLIKQKVHDTLSPPNKKKSASVSEDWINQQLNSLPVHYLSGTAPERIALDMGIVRTYQPGDIQVDGEFLPDTATVAYRIITHENSTSGCFHKSAGVLTAKGLEILAAQICTSRDGIVIDGFQVRDRDFSGPVPRARIDEVSAALREVLSGKLEVAQMFRKHRRFTHQRVARPLSDLPTRVVIDTQSSDDYTVIDIFAHDRPGLLYAISRTIFELGLSVVLAKISTHLDQVVDVFYVADQAGGKVVDENRLREIETRLMTRLEEFGRDSQPLATS